MSKVNPTNMEVTLSYTVDKIHPVSTNDMYFHNPMKSKKNPNRMTTIAIRTPELKAYQSAMAEALIDLYPEDVLHEFKSSVVKHGSIGISLVIVFMMPADHYWSSDASNYIKALEDTIVKHSGIDDVHHVVITIAKGLSDDDDWHVHILQSLCPMIPK